MTTFNLQDYVICASDAFSFVTDAHIVVDGGFSLP
jgi:hypothetical protein